MPLSLISSNSASWWCSSKRAAAYCNNSLPITCHTKPIDAVSIPSTTRTPTSLIGLIVKQKRSIGNCTSTRSKKSSKCYLKRPTLTNLRKVGSCRRSWQRSSGVKRSTGIIKCSLRHLSQVRRSKVIQLVLRASPFGNQGTRWVRQWFSHKTMGVQATSGRQVPSPRMASQWRMVSFLKSILKVRLTHLRPFGVPKTSHL